MAPGEQHPDLAIRLQCVCLGKYSVQTVYKRSEWQKEFFAVWLETFVRMYSERMTTVQWNYSLPLDAVWRSEDILGVDERSATVKAAIVY